ncbi:MAG: peptidoglycan DD-metalloendopeptidase family protein [Oscillospiraceae bacterium]|nr:peptidoglycan DD-metalloendopeptidase family protein [Oscillospiraceae bacterium]
MDSENFISALGRCVCETGGKIASSVSDAVRRILSVIGRAAAPLRKDILFVLSTVVKGAGRLFSAATEGTAARVKDFNRRRKMFGMKKSAYMGFCEIRLAFKRKGKPAVTFINMAFPIAAAAFLIGTVAVTLSQDYGVSVEYDGKEMGVVEEDGVISEAQCTVADIVEYYDTGDDYYVTATLAIRPLTSNDEVIDGVTLAGKMEERISDQYDHIDAEAAEEPEEAVTVEETESIAENLVEAFKVIVDGECLGYVYDNEPIDSTLSGIKAEYESDEYTEIGFSKDVEYTEIEYVEPDEITSVDSIVEQLTGYESSPEYYEVQDGDNLWKIAKELDIDLDVLTGSYATYDGEVVELGDNIKVGTLIQIESEVPYLQVECKKELTYRSSIDYETITIEDDSMLEGETVVEVEGQEGERYTRAVVTYVDDTAVRKKNLDSIIVEEPVSEIIRVGTGNGIDHNVPEFSDEGGNGEYFWPVEGGTITAYQGEGRDHKGIDISAPYGTPVYAAASGTVIDVGSGWNSGYGNAVMIQNDDGNVTMYAHLAEAATELDQTVEEGQLIGYVGSTGDSSGNHLHFEVRTSDGKYMDPCTFVSQDAE